jgi:hypothetical protein
VSSAVECPCRLRAVHDTFLFQMEHIFVKSLKDVFCDEIVDLPLRANNPENWRPAAR